MGGNLACAGGVSAETSASGLFGLFRLRDHGDGQPRPRESTTNPSWWLAVLRPFNEGVHPRTVAALINTKLNKNGLARATIGSMTVSINPDGDWTVDRR